MFRQHVERLRRYLVSVSGVRSLALFLLLILGICVGSVASAAVISVDDPVHGVDALTRDTDQGLDFLDVNLTDGQSFDHVSIFLSVPPLVGFRYATETEVINLINNWGFSPGASFNTDTEGDIPGQLFELIDMLGVTTFGSVAWATNGLTGTVTSPNHVRVVTIRQDLSLPQGNWVNTRLSEEMDCQQSFNGSFLVRPSPPVPAVPEPASIAIFGIGAVLLGMARWRRRRA